MKILYLVHRIPYPPDKGDKIRSFRWLRHLARDHEVHLVTLCDDPADRRHVPELERLCASVHVADLNPLKKRTLSLGSLPTRQPLSLRYFFERSAAQAVGSVLRDVAIDAILCFSSPMAEYVRHVSGIPRVMDMVDVDSAKFETYAGISRWPQRTLYAVEGRRLRVYEAELTRELDAVVLCTEPECELLRERGARGRIECIRNGADLPGDDQVPPSRTSSDLLFIGAMDYFANVDAVEFGAREIMPRVLARCPEARFLIVGRDPAPAVRALDRLPGVSVLGAQADLRGFLTDAAVSLIPLRIARGIQNKVLEAMAWSLPVVTPDEIARSIGATPGEHLLVAEDAEGYANEVIRLLGDAALRDRIGAAARRLVRTEHAWEPHCARLERLLEELAGAGVG